MEKDVTRYLVLVFVAVLTMIGSTASGMIQSDPLNKKITIKVEAQSLSSILDKISTDYNVEFSYNSKIVNSIFFSSIDVVNTPLDQLLFDLLNEHRLNYKESNGVIIIVKTGKESMPDELRKVKVVHGYLTNKTTGKPIDNVNVFVANTTIGTSSNSEGFYQISTYEDGLHELIFSHVNYFPVIKSLDLTSQKKDIEISFSMAEKINKLEEVVIKDSKKEWEKRLKIFEREFLGPTPNTRNNKILNPWVIDFTYDRETDMLKATAEDLLIVENQALGYNLSHLIELFEYQKGQVRYLSKIKFEEIPQLNHVKKRKVVKRRKEAFLGSFDHFVRALTKHNLKKQGFEISLVNSLGNNRTRSIINSENIMQQKNEGQRILFSGFLEIVYKDAEENSYKNFVKKKSQKLWTISENETYRRQTSALEIITSKGYVVVGSNMSIDPLSVRQHGYWSWKRTSDILPSDFKLASN